MEIEKMLAYRMVITVITILFASVYNLAGTLVLLNALIAFSLGAEALPVLGCIAGIGCFIAGGSLAFCAEKLYNATHAEGIP